MTQHTQVTRRRTAARLLAAVVGVVYLVLAVAGFALTGTGEFTQSTAHQVLIFDVSTLQNIVHAVVGVLGLLAAWQRTGNGTQFYGWAVLVVFFVLFCYGTVTLLASTGVTGDPLNLNWPDNWLHLVTAVAGLAIGVLALRSGPTRTANARPGFAGPQSAPGHR
ncbi:DUF4383 domain-containing protein [Goodfellowiella coeruleoviolacea]|uniref:DUF4383 domain-containing protein n=1 Tax=Goodfellowiella coeruleoviolacea TaxID=334858 RepID=A0AAE3KD81_9PSEU|nr:DUF4383 domain-containing protein [Goodfellowiella coeruleoviolacea]MCP2163746.1 protein of unknown function (DUF4383) [Goodfellowiella coeruleoviolacea]